VKLRRGLPAPLGDPDRSDIPTRRFCRPPKASPSLVPLPLSGGVVVRRGGPARRRRRRSASWLGARVRAAFGAVFPSGLLSPTTTFRRAHGRIRTCDARFRKPTLYPLSYVGWVSALRSWQVSERI
jgi:hypothetical protein